MFSLGLEFSLRKRAQVGADRRARRRRSRRSVMLWLGYIIGQLLRLDAAARASSPARSSRSPARRSSPRRSTSSGVTAELREIVFGILIVEDLIAILLLAMLTAVASRRRPVSSAVSARPPARLAAFLVGLVGVGMLVVPRVVRAVVATRAPRDDARRERRHSASRSRCSRCTFGYSVALGAFIAGSLVAESGEAERDRATRRSRCATCSPRSSSCRSAC